MIFRVKLTNGHAITFERDRVGNVLIVVHVNGADEPLGSTVEKGSDFSKMAGILCD